MITNNFKALLGTVLQSSGTQWGFLPIRDTYGRQYFLDPNFDSYTFPYSRTLSVALSINGLGISLGRGNRAESERDYCLQDTITSGINVAITGGPVYPESPGNLYHQINMTVTNTSGSTIIINEIGYKQRVRAASGPYRNENNELVILLDRTVLETPLTLAAGDAGVIHYKLKTVMDYPIIGGIQMAPFAYGTDEQIAAIIDAAQMGVIDLQEDAGWDLSDCRKIHIEAFTDGQGTSYPAQDIEIAIASFADYNNCGCVLQFDFMQALTIQKRLHNQNSTVGGYGVTEMYQDVLPALVNAMPEWIKNRLKKFTVKSWDTGTNAIVDVPNNKLALRARVEYFGNGNMDTDAEGSIVPLYSRLSVMRSKGLGYNRTSSFYYWTRTPYNRERVRIVYYNNPGANDYSYLTDARGIAPFGCM